MLVFSFCPSQWTIRTNTGPCNILQDPYDMQTSSNFQFIVRCKDIHHSRLSSFLRLHDTRSGYPVAQPGAACLRVSMLDGTLEVWRRMEMSTSEDGTCSIAAWQHRSDMYWYVISLHHGKVACVVGQGIDRAFAYSTAGASSAHQKLGLNNGLT